MKKIIFFFSQPPETYNDDRFRFDIFIKNGFYPVYVDLSLFFVKKDHKYKFKSLAELINIKSTKDFLIFFFNEKNNFFFADCTTYNSLIFNLFQFFLKLRGCIKIQFSTSTVSASHLLTTVEKLKILIKKKKYISIFFHFINFIFNYFVNKFKTKPDYLFISGLKEKNNKYKKELIYSSSIDYNYYLRSNKKKLKIKKNNQIVYLDQNLLHHREFFITKERAINRKFFLDYYKSLFIFLNYLHKKYKLKIVICFHPRCTSHGEKFLRKLFNRRIYNFSRNTSLEIKKSKFVVFNYSNAHQIAALYKKPMLVVHKLSQKYFDYEVKKKTIIQISKNLSLDVLDLNKNYENFEFKFKIDNKKYDQYIANYISAIYPKKKFSWNIVINKLKRISGKNK